MNNDDVLDLSELSSVSITKNLLKGEKVLTDGYKKNTHIKSKGQCKNRYVSQKIHIFFCTTVITKYLK